ncbi:HD-like signal output (HDOD) protein [Inmirania thermothiophila]|uniref:HD-like signal output (HDOD) protein n=1 Tax=Inmirania thermothiophila TaxID=1750597 RepID=A0A3N1Y1A5_9GAMM|nr:HD-like signal output (HDOD) protein [Inmirania thermothiophila]
MAAGTPPQYLAPAVQAELDRRDVAYRVVARGGAGLAALAEAGRVPAERAVRAVVLADRAGWLLALLPVQYLIDFHVLQTRLGRWLSPVPAGLASARFGDCDPGVVPTLGAPYGLPLLVESSLQGEEEVFLEGGRRGVVIAVSGPDFARLTAEAQVLRFAWPPRIFRRIAQAQPGQRVAEVADLRPERRVAALLARVRELPAMPEMGARLLALRRDPKANARDLAAVVELDPSLAAQVMRYARSPLYGYRGRIETVHDAVARVLGFDFVLSLALGLALGRTLRAPREGPLGLAALWRGAVYTAGLCQLLAPLLPAKIRLLPGLAYLAGLLHNFGILVWSELLRPEYFLIHRMMQARPEVPLPVLEREVLGIGEDAASHELAHARLGARLLAQWGLPEEVVVAAREHHNEGYRGEHAVAANLVLAAASALRREGIGDAADQEPPPAVLTALGLERAQVLEQAARLLAAAPELDAFARSLAA